MPLLLFTLIFLPLSLSHPSLPLSFCVCALCPAASESVLLQQLFQSKLTQTGSLVPAAQSRAGLRGPKAALLLHRMPSASLVTANTVPQQPRRYHDLTKVRYIVDRMVRAGLHMNHSYRRSVVALLLYGQLQNIREGCCRPC